MASDILNTFTVRSVYVHLSQLYEPKHLSRDKNAEKIADLQRSITSNGYLSSGSRIVATWALTTATGKRELMIVDGVHRANALRFAVQNGMSKLAENIPVDVLELEKDEKGHRACISPAQCLALASHFNHIGDNRRTVTMIDDLHTVFSTMEVLKGKVDNQSDRTLSEEFAQMKVVGGNKSAQTLRNYIVVARALGGPETNAWMAFRNCFNAKKAQKIPLEYLVQACFRSLETNELKTAVIWMTFLRMQVSGQRRDVRTVTKTGNGVLTESTDKVFVHEISFRTEKTSLLDSMIVMAKVVLSARNAMSLSWHQYMNSSMEEVGQRDFASYTLPSVTVWSYCRRACAKWDKLFRAGVLPELCHVLHPSPVPVEIRQAIAHHEKHMTREARKTNRDHKTDTDLPVPDVSSPVDIGKEEGNDGKSGQRSEDKKVPVPQDRIAPWIVRTDAEKTQSVALKETTTSSGIVLSSKKSLDSTVGFDRRTKVEHSRNRSTGKAAGVVDNNMDEEKAHGNGRSIVNRMHKDHRLRRFVEADVDEEKASVQEFRSKDKRRRLNVDVENLVSDNEEEPSEHKRKRIGDDNVGNNAVVAGEASRSEAGRKKRAGRKAAMSESDRQSGMETMSDTDSESCIVRKGQAEDKPMTKAVKQIDEEKEDEKEQNSLEREIWTNSQLSTPSANKSSTGLSLTEGLGCSLRLEEKAFWDTIHVGVHNVQQMQVECLGFCIVAGVWSMPCSRSAMDQVLDCARDTLLDEVQEENMWMVLPDSVGKGKKRSAGKGLRKISLGTRFWDYMKQFDEEYEAKRFIDETMKGLASLMMENADTLRTPVSGSRVVAEKEGCRVQEPRTAFKMNAEQKFEPRKEASFILFSTGRDPLPIFVWPLSHFYDNAGPPYPHLREKKIEIPPYSMYIARSDMTWAYAGVPGDEVFADGRKYALHLQLFCMNKTHSIEGDLYNSSIFRYVEDGRGLRLYGRQRA